MARRQAVPVTTWSSTRTNSHQRVRGRIPPSQVAVRSIRRWRSSSLVRSNREKPATGRAGGSPGRIEAGDQLGLCARFSASYLALHFPVAFVPGVTPDEEAILPCGDAGDLALPSRRGLHATTPTQVADEDS